MAVRLHMNLGLVAEPQRLPDSADTVIVVEPNIGSTSRTKGSLYLLVTGAGGRKLREATKIVAERIRDDYYYDLSAGISVCLRKAVRAANKMLMHSPDRPVVGPGEPGPIGLALAVIRGNELYVATLGPAEAYLLRQARLLTLPDSSPESGMPVRRRRRPGGLARRDHRRRLPDPDVAQRDPAHRPGADPGRRPADPSPGGGRARSTASSVRAAWAAPAATASCSSRPPRWRPRTRPRRSSPSGPATRWPGAPDRSPIPLADTVVGGVAAMQTTAHQAQLAADGWLRRGVYSLFDRMPERPMSRGRVTPMTVRRERRQRAAVAIIGLLAVIALVGSVMWFMSGASRGDNVDVQQIGAAGISRKAQADVDAVSATARTSWSATRARPTNT